jgi:hypothetical protein
MKPPLTSHSAAAAAPVYNAQIVFPVVKRFKKNLIFF